VAPVQIRIYSLTGKTATGPGPKTKSWMKQPSPLTRLAYMSDYTANTVTVYGRNASVQGQIGGLSYPQGLFVDSSRNVWVANAGGPTILEYARGSTSPSVTLSDPVGEPADVTVCPNGTVYVSNIVDTSTGTGSIQVYAGGSTSPTGSLFTSGPIVYGLFITCDKAGNVFWDYNTTASGGGTVVGFTGGVQSGLYSLGISTSGYAGGLKVNDAGNLVVGDQSGHTITEYTEAGTPTGNSINTGSGTIVDIAVTRNSFVVGGADAVGFTGTSWTFPAGAHRQTYPDQAPPSATFPIGFAFDPAQKGI
jgi:hypothetical protein